MPLASWRVRSVRRPGLGFVLAALVAGALASCDRAAEPDTIRLGVIQTTGVPGDVAANVDHAERLVRDAAAQGARWIVFPELYALYPAARSYAGREAIHREAADGEAPVRERMLALAEELDVNIAVGMPELDGERLYNTLLFVEPDGSTATYRKHLLIPTGPEEIRENLIFTAGDQPPLVEWGGIPVGAVICADSGMDGFWRHAGSGEMALVVWASSSGRRGSPRAPTPVDRARISRVPVAFANRSRPDDRNPMLGGGSKIVDATGSTLAEAGAESDAVLVADVPLRRK